MKLHSITLEGFRGIATSFMLPLGSKNLLLHGENGAAKTSIAKALELLLDPESDRDLLSQKNLFGNADRPSKRDSREKRQTRTQQHNSSSSMAWKKRFAGIQALKSLFHRGY